MRIIAGEFKSRRLTATPGLSTRPTADRLRETIFNILALRVRNRSVLDLFAGTGAMGLEAVSRGAASALLVDIHRRSIEAMEKNIRSLNVAHRVRTRQADAAAPGAGYAPAGAVFDLIFIDPPYEKGLIAPAMSALARRGAAADGAIIVAEHAAGEDPGGGLDCRYVLTDARKYGKTGVSFFIFNPNANPAAETETGE